MHINPKKLQKIVRQYGLRLLLLFGSRAQDKALPKSDFDIAYFAGRPLSLEEESRLIVDLGPAVGSDNIDLVDLKKAPPLLLYAITQNARVLYAENQMLFPELASYAFKRYVESKLLFELKRQFLIASL